jgi:hypothetical protein
MAKDNGDPIQTGCTSYEYNNVNSDYSNYGHIYVQYNKVNTDTTTTTAQHQRLRRATEPEVMGENDFNRTSRSRQQVSMASTVNFATSSTSPKSTSSDSVQIIQPPSPTGIDLTLKSIENLMMADVQERKAVSNNETSKPKAKATKGKRKHVATGSPRERPPRYPSKNGDRDKGQGLA